MTSCMGGWCNQRANCRRYVSLSIEEPVERWCEKGRDDPVPLRNGERQPDSRETEATK